ncbi:hypothetical protein [Pseudomonas sp. 2995-1]|uniref:hypothetical protein n=1 Tax=Pseudomonas sp. 2995-1 TaxID=1712679 RepID=UPI000C14B168|nr:hypothetical protein [Pseudomonas sp. 2995-1]PIB57211.1 hypothetical protein AOA61_07555 [Pseudomonas sp. 2995-1]
MEPDQGVDLITRQLKKGMEQKLLALIYRKYVERLGHGVRNLREFPIWITSAEVYLPDMPELREYDENMARDLFVDVMRELEASGYVIFDSNIAFFLTEAGYGRASMTPVDKFLDFCNKNQGLAVPISIVSLIVSFAALWAGT